MELRCEDIEYSIAGNRILKGITMGVSNNEFHTILGPNGCGKTTLLKTIYRIVKPETGTVYLDGRPQKDISIRQSAQQMAVVAQFNNLNFDCSVLDVVMLGRTPHLKMMEQEKAQDYEIAYDALRKVGMYDKKDRSYLSLSGGEKQRVVLARAITQQPTLLLLDEPTNHLDIKYQLEILRIVKELNINVLAVLHDIQLACRFSDYIYLVRDGRIRHQGTPEQAITKENMKEIYDVDCEVLNQGNNHILIQYICNSAVAIGQKAIHGCMIRLLIYKKENHGKGELRNEKIHITCAYSSTYNNTCCVTHSVWQHTESVTAEQSGRGCTADISDTVSGHNYNLRCIGQGDYTDF